MKVSVTSSIATPSIEGEKKGKVEKKSGKRVGYNYIIVKSYKESQKNDVVKCLYIKSLTNFGFCVIKEGSYGDTKDKNGRDIIDRLRWQKQLHSQLQDQIPIPKLLDHFEEGGNYYLVIEHLRGKALQKLCHEHRRELRASIMKGSKPGIRFLGYLVQITHILEKLHALQFVHRDATPNNYMVTSKGKVVLIDMEMCYSIGTAFPTPAFQLGTYGYMSPQQEATKTPTTAEDIFALGAIILQLWSGISPGKLTTDPIDMLAEKIRFFVPHKQISQMIVECLSPDDTKRPSVILVRKALETYIREIRYGNLPQPNIAIYSSTEEILTTIRESINTMSSPMMSDEEKGWFANNMNLPDNADKHKLHKVWYASYNRGAAGIIYLSSQFKDTGIDPQILLSNIEKGLRLIKERYIDRIEQTTGGLHYGANGIAAALASAIKSGFIPFTRELQEWINLLLERANESLGFGSGLAGQGMANLICRSFVNQDYLNNRLINYAETLINKQDKAGFWPQGYYRQKFTKRMKNRVLYGFMEGMAGIIYFLLEYGYLYNHTASIEAAKQGLNWLIRQAKTDKETVYWKSYKGKELDFGWDDGASGIALTLLKAYELSRESIYKQYAIKALRRIPANFVDGNLSQEGGISGIGEVYLEAWRILKEEEWLHRAEWIAQVIMKLRKTSPEFGSYWLVEYERQPVSSFMIGNGGVIHFLLRFCFPDKIHFPLMQ